LQTFPEAKLAQLLPPVMALAREAGAAILTHYGPEIEVRRKEDASPVTAADEEAEEIILAGLRQLTPDLPIVSEEAFARGEISSEAPPRFWLVDPLDGTKEFLKRNGEFTVNIALVERTAPVLGIVHLPALDEIYRGHSGIAERSVAGAAFERIAARRPPAEGGIMTISRSHAADERVKVESLGERVQGTMVAGSSLKFCRLAEGVADLYPRFGTTMEWDTAAGHAVLAAAGGSISTIEGAPLSYGKAGFRNPHFIARGRRG
jgi:3'(2'), 5'-bisphosphate nucleotidase